MYVYKQSEPNLFTVGHYDPKELWVPESDHSERGKAAERVHYLNGGVPEEKRKILEKLDKIEGILLGMLK